MRTLVAVEVCLLAVCASVAAAQEPDPPLCLAAYYTWYGTPRGAAGSFQHWGGTLTPADGSTVTYDPEAIAPQGIREITSTAYPLIGPYDSMDREVVRWHMRLAKAAGLDGFLVDWWGPAGWQTPPGWTHDVFVNTVLPVAEEEGFPVALFDECPQFVDDFDAVCDWTADALATYAQSPAWLRIDAKPVWAVYQLWEGKLTPEQGRELIDRVEAKVGPVYWIFDRMLCRPGEDGMELYAPDEWLANERIDCFMGYAMFSTWRADTYDALAPMYKGYADAVHATGHRVMLPVHPGHDNTGINPEPYVIPRRDGETLRDFWRAATDAGSDFVLVTSWNEWPETTVLEPSLTWDDPYQYLRVLADLRGTGFVPPPLPPDEHLDPLIRESLRARMRGAE